MRPPARDAAREQAGDRAPGAGRGPARAAAPPWAGRLATGALLAGLAAAAFGALAALDGRSRAEASPERLYLPSGVFLREATVGFRELAADWLWFQAVQYYGEYRQGRHGLEYFRGMIRNVTTLDPCFLEAHRFGALVLATDMGDVPGALDVLKRGIAANPGRWLLPFEVGFIHYLLRRDVPRAAVWFDAAARAPDADDFARRFAAFAHRRAGQPEVALALWSHLRQTTSSAAMRDLADREIARCEEQIRRRDAAAREGRP